MPFIVMHAGVRFSLAPPLWYAPGGLITTVLSLGLAPPGRTKAVFQNPPLVADSPPSISVAPLVADSPPSISVAFVMYLYVVNNIYRLFDPFTDGNNRLVCNFL